MDDRPAGERREEAAAQGLAAAVRALDALRKRPLEAEVASDRSKVADLLFDHARHFEPDALLDLLTDLLLPELDELAREHCLREYLLLDPHALAEETVVKLFLEHTVGQRRRPFARWARRALREAAEDAIEDDDKQLFQAGPDATPGQRLMAALAREVNHEKLVVRRIVWLTFVERLAARAVADAVALPLETVERLLERTMRRAHRALEETDGHVWEEGPWRLEDDASEEEGNA